MLIQLISSSHLAWMRKQPLKKTAAETAESSACRRNSVLVDEWVVWYYCILRFLGLARTAYVHRIRPYIWWFRCQKCRIYTLYTLVLANPMYISWHTHPTERAVAELNITVCAAVSKLLHWFTHTIELYYAALWYSARSFLIMQLFDTVHALSLLCSSLAQCTLFPYYAALWYSARSFLIMQLFGTVHALPLLCSSLAQCTLFPSDASTTDNWFQASGWHYFEMSAFFGLVSNQAESLSSLKFAPSLLRKWLPTKQVADA